MDGDSSSSSLTRFVVDLSPTDLPDVAGEVDVISVLTRTLCSIYPELFTTVRRGKRKSTKLLQLAMMIVDDRLHDRQSGSLLDYAKMLGWKRKSVGRVSDMFRRLADIGFIGDTRARKLNDAFFQKLRGDATRLTIEATEIFRYTGILLKLFPALHVDPNAYINGSFTFRNTAELITALEFVLGNVPTGDDIFLILREGATWASHGIGNIMRILLKNAVQQKKLKLYVITTALIDPTLRAFFESIGAQVLVDEHLDGDFGCVRYLIIGDYVISIDKSANIKNSGIIFQGLMKKAWAGDRQWVRDRVANLLSAQEVS